MTKLFRSYPNTEDPMRFGSLSLAFLTGAVSRRCPAALDGAVAMLDRAWAVPTPEREPETVTKPAPEGENRASESDWGAEGWEAPEAGLEPATRRLTAGCSTS